MAHELSTCSVQLSTVDITDLLLYYTGAPSPLRPAYSPLQWIPYIVHNARPAPSVSILNLCIKTMTSTLQLVFSILGLVPCKHYYTYMQAVGGEGYRMQPANCMQGARLFLREGNV